MPRRKPLQTNFSAGELAPELTGRLDTEQYQNGAKSLLNRRCLIGGGTKRRPGSWHEAELVGASRIEAFIVSADTAYILVFSSGRMDAYSVNAATGHLTAAGSVTGAPWTGTIWREMDYAQAANTAFLVHPTMAPQSLVRTGASTWTRAAVSFFVGAGGRIEQPYFKVAAASITLTPSARTGSITLTASAAAFTAAHVGTRVRILQREISITGFTSSTVVTGTVIENLRPTVNCTIDSDSGIGAIGGMAVGETVVGGTSGRKGIITALTDATHIKVLMTSTLDAFDATEDLIGPNRKAKLSAVAATTDAATTDWDEQLFSSFNGYPACVTLHRNRLLFGGHPAVANALIGSKNTNLYSFDVGNASDGDGIFETIGDAGASSIVQLHSAEQLLVLTDLGPYYCPENASSPFRPTSIAFFPFGSPWSITATLEPRGFDDGVLFASKSLIIKARPTGDQTRLWGADEVSLLSTHIVSNPSRIAVTSNFAGGAERYAVLVNDDGTLAVLQLVDAQKIRNMTPWTTAGIYTSVAAIGGFLYATSERTINGSLRYFVEFFDNAVTLDLVTQYDDQGVNDSFVKALLHFDDVDASVTITDSNGGGSAHTWTANGNAQIDTADSKFGGASGLFDGTGDYVSSPDHADFTLGSGDWTVDFWFKTSAAGGTFRFLAGQNDSTPTTASTSFRIGRTNTNIIQALACVGSTAFTINGTTQFTDVINPGWHHAAFVRTGDILKLFLNGVQEGGDVAITGAVNNSANALSVGRIGEYVNDPWLGWVDEFRISIGIARWTANFTPPTQPSVIPARYGSTTINVVTADLAYHLGTYPPVLSTLPPGPYQVGLYYDSVVELLPPVLDDAEGAHAGELRRICQAYVQVLQSARFEANGHELAAYAVTDPVDIAPPRRNGWQQFDFLGWDIDPTVAIRQPDPLPLDVLAVKTIVAF